MTKPTGVREIIEGIDINELSLEFGWRGGPVFGEKKNFASVVKAVVDKAAFDKVVAIALELETQRNEKILGVERWPTTDAIADHYNADLLKIAKESV